MAEKTLIKKVLILYLEKIFKFIKILGKFINNF